MREKKPDSTGYWWYAAKHAYKRPGLREIVPMLVWRNSENQLVCKGMTLDRFHRGTWYGRCLFEPEMMSEDVNERQRLAAIPEPECVHHWHYGACIRCRILLSEWQKSQPPPRSRD